MNTGVHGRNAASATWRLWVTRSEGRTSFARSHVHSLSRFDAFSSRLRPGQGGSGASCSTRTAAPAAAHAAHDAVDGSPRRASAIPGRAASASTGGFRHSTSGVGTGAIVIASTSTSVRVWSASIFKNTSPTRRVARSPWATTTSIEFTSTMIAGMYDRRHPICAVQLRSAAVAAEAQAQNRRDRFQRRPILVAPAWGRRALVDAGSLLVVVVSARELDEAVWLVTYAPGVMARRQEHDVARGEVLGGAVVEHHAEGASEHQGHVRELARRRPRVGLEVLGPACAYPERHLGHAHAVELCGALCDPPVHVRACIGEVRALQGGVVRGHGCLLVVRDDRSVCGPPVCGRSIQSGRGGAPLPRSEGDVAARLADGLRDDAAAHEDA